jgi:hypothetical protein
MFQAHTKCKKKKLNVGEVQTLTPLQFAIFQRETEKRDKRTQRDRAKMGRKTKHLPYAWQKIMKSLACQREWGMSVSEKAYYYDL